MKKYIILIIVLLLGLSLSAQTQQGYVKTKGRMVNGKLVPGQGLKGATVSIQDRTPIVVQSVDGSFSFPIPTQTFTVKSVQKNGYQLVDADVVKKTYNYSSNPIYLVMETPEQQMQDQLAAERKIRRTLNQQLQQREDEIENLKEQQKISDEEYRKALQELYEKTDQNEQLVKDMVERYSKIDYDQLSEFDQQISDYILNGGLIKADSLLNTKGNISERLEQYHKLEAINAKEQKELSQRKKHLEQSQALALQERNDLANDCYRKFEIFEMQHQYDSAGYYIDLSVNLDTTNIERESEAGRFFGLHLADYEKASLYLNRSLQLCKNISDSAHCYMDIANYIYSLQGQYDTAIYYLERSLYAYKAYYDINQDLFCGLVHYSLGTNYRELSQFDKASYHLEQALNSELSQEDLMLHHVLFEKGRVYYDQKEYDKALIEFERSLEIRKALFGEDSESVSTIYINIMSLYLEQGNYEKALCYAKLAHSIRQIAFGLNDPKTIKSQKVVDRLTYKVAIDNHTDLTDFNTDHCFTATVNEGETPASQQGMIGEYVLLEFGNWNQDCLTSLYDKNTELKGKPKDILVLKDGIISKHHFDNVIGAQLGVKYVGKEEKQRIDALYEEWKKQNRP